MFRDYSIHKQLIEVTLQPKLMSMMELGYMLDLKSDVPKGVWSSAPLSSKKIKNIYGTSIIILMELGMYVVW